MLRRLSTQYYILCLYKAVLYISLIGFTIAGNRRYAPRYTERDGLRTCSGCRLHRYCDANCQAADWKKEHKMECAMLKGLTVYWTGVEKMKVKPPGGPVDGFSAAAMMVLMSKIKRKVQAKVLDEIPGLGPKSVENILSLFPSNPGSKEVKFSWKWFPMNNPGMDESDFAATCISSVMECSRNVEWNAFPILNPDSKMRAVGAALFPQAPHRTMTAVCWDSNVSMDFRGRRLFVHATEDIPSYQGLKDIRYCEFVWNPLYLTRAGRRLWFEEMHSYPCGCQKCTAEYEAEINPLKCTTAGCSERLPSDQRSLAPCQQCGVTNPDRLEQFQRFFAKYELIQKRAEDNRLSDVEKQRQLGVLLKEIDAAGILYADAHIRFLCGWELAGQYEAEGKYEEAWKLYQELVGCVRRTMPKYHIDRAHCLNRAGACPVKYMKKVPFTGDGLFTRNSAFHRMVPVFFGDYTIWMGYCTEARDIYEKLYGGDSQRAKETQAMIEDCKDLFGVMLSLVQGNL